MVQSVGALLSRWQLTQSAILRGRTCSTFGMLATSPWHIAQTWDSATSIVLSYGGVGVDPPSLVDPDLRLAVAQHFDDLLGAGEGPDVGLVYEVDVIGHPVDPHPVDLSARLREVPKRLHAFEPAAHCLVAAHAELYGGDRRGRLLGHRPVAEGAVEPDLVYVHGMREGYRLVRSLAEAEDGESEPSTTI